MKERGLFYPDLSFKSDSEVKRKLALEGDLPEIQFIPQVKVPLDVDVYLAKAQERSDQMKELSPRAENFVKITLPETSMINVIADAHLGSLETDTERVRQELNVILNTPNSYFIFAGDLVEGIHWGGASGAEQALTLDGQRMFLRSLFETTKGKVLLGVSGEHDAKWASKTGSDPYFDFSERTGAPYIRGVAEVEVNIGEQVYRLIVQHRARGFSMYNKNHPTFREARFELQDGDVYISCHTHAKQISQETIRKFGRADVVTHISVGPYTRGGVYGDRSGFVRQLPKEMYGAAFRLNEDKKQVDVYYDILEANRVFGE